MNLDNGKTQSLFVGNWIDTSNKITKVEFNIITATTILSGSL